MTDSFRLSAGHARALLAVVLGVTVGLLGSPLTAVAAFADRDTASLSVSTATLQPPTAPGTAPGVCTLAGDAIVVTWTRSASPQVSGYEILRSTAAAGPFSTIATAPGYTTESYTDSPLAFSTTYYYVVRAIRNNWRSATTSPVSRTTRSLLCVV